MSLKILFRTIVFLLLLFVVIYTAMVNTDEIKFSFPLLLAKPVQAPAPIIFFAIFAVGVLAGTVLNAGGGKKGSGSEKKK